MTSTSYYSFLLRIWQVNSEGRQEWRVMLEDVEAGSKHGFASLEELCAYLKQVTTGTNQQAGEGNHVEVQD